jgi:hypothetical protein
MVASVLILERQGASTATLSEAVTLKALNQHFLFLVILLVILAFVLRCSDVRRDAASMSLVSICKIWIYASRCAVVHFCARGG